MILLCLIIAILASLVGSICGIGGGVLIKAILDFCKVGSVSTISFLSGCTVLSMAFYSVGKAILAKESKVDLKTGTALAAGAALGGVVGKQLFTAVKNMFENGNLVGAVQSLCVLLITLGTLIYTLKKDKIKTLKINSKFVCILIGFFLGIMSSFLGIGGGPINLVVLYFFFSMETKTAAQNSLYIILFSQITSLVFTLATHTVPQFDWLTLIMMAVGGILGGILGRNQYKKMDNKAVEKLFEILMIVIMAISAYNSFQYAI